MNWVNFLILFSKKFFKKKFSCLKNHLSFFVTKLVREGRFV